MPKLYLISGETSGEIHGANLIQSILKIGSPVQFRAWGGDNIQSLGIPLAIHIKETNFMGFWEVISHLPQIWRLFKYAKQDILKFSPDAVILIDYPGFNLRMAKWLKSKNIPVIYYISPQIWAWKTGRIHTIKDTVDLMITILPFEKEFYKKFNFDVEYVGHPLLDEINKQTNPISRSQLKPTIAILPGSRLQEIKGMLPVMWKAAKKMDHYNPVIVKAPAISIEEYHKLLETEDHHCISDEGSITILRNAELAVVSSGTATLEAAILDVPQVVCYKGSNISYQIAKNLVKLKHISLVNLILGKPAVKELIQNDFNFSNLKNAMHEAIDNSEKIKGQYAVLRSMLGNEGASDRAAKKILSHLRTLY